MSNLLSSKAGMCAMITMVRLVNEHNGLITIDVTDNRGRIYRISARQISIEEPEIEDKTRPMLKAYELN